MASREHILFDHPMSVTKADVDGISFTIDHRRLDSYIEQIAPPVMTRQNTPLSPSAFSYSGGPAVPFGHKRTG